MTAPTEDLLTIEEVKAQCRISSDDEDELLRFYAEAAMGHIEMETHRQLLPATYLLGLDEFPRFGRGFLWQRADGGNVYWGCAQRADMIELPRPPLQSVTSVVYIDSAGAQQTLATDQYGVDTLSEPGKIYLLPGKVWPVVYAVPNAVQVTFVAGYASIMQVPADLRAAARLLAAHLYENREATVEKALTDIPLGVCRFLANHTMRDFY
jgi:hypothetical protein